MHLLLASAVLGFLKGFLEPQSAGPSSGFSFETDIWGPAREELIYRAAPLWAFPKLPYGSTAVVFAVDHVLSDFTADKGTLTPTVALARFGDVLLGGLIYERAFRKHGIGLAVGSHSLHNLAVSLGAKLRG